MKKVRITPIERRNPSRRVVIVMAKQPRPGRVKSRLGRDIGMVEACWWYRHQLARLLRNIGRDPRWQVVLAVSPDDTRFDTNLPSMPQGSGELGHRMLRALKVFSDRDVVLVGSDIPALDCDALWHSFGALQGKDMVFGPATDGGYWMIGARPSACFGVDSLATVRWSTEQTLQDSIALLSPRNRIGLGQYLSDVDRGADLKPRF